MEMMARKDWVDKFKMKSLLYNIKFTREAATADKKAARKFIFTFFNINEDETYSLCQIFSIGDMNYYFGKRSLHSHTAILGKGTIS